MIIAKQIYAHNFITMLKMSHLFEWQSVRQVMASDGDYFLLPGDYGSFQFTSTLKYFYLTGCFNKIL
jgi:hypothetical protein